MKILGIGIDIVENSRISKSLKNDFFTKRIFTNLEIINSSNIKDKKKLLCKTICCERSFCKIYWHWF